MGTAESWQPLDLTDDHPQLAGERECYCVVYGTLASALLTVYRQHETLAVIAGGVCVYPQGGENMAVTGLSCRKALVGTRKKTSLLSGCS